MRTFTPAIYNTSSAVGFDYEIGTIQSKLARISWMQAIFGKALRQSRILSESETLNQLNPSNGLRGQALYSQYFPQGRKLDQDIDLSFDDSYASMCFFFALDPENPAPDTYRSDWTDPNVEISQKFSLIFFANINKLKSNQNEIVTTEMLKLQIIYALNLCPKLAFKADSIYENIENVWHGFDLTTELENFSKFPYYCLRIDCAVTYVAFPSNGLTIFDPSICDVPQNETILPNTDKGNTNLN